MGERPTPREYIKGLRAACKDTVKQGRQIDFWDAFVISRPTGEQAAYWMLPALRECQEERAAFLVKLAELEALVAEYFATTGGWEPDAFLAELEARMRRTQGEARELVHAATSS